MNDIVFSSKRIRCSHCGSSDGFAPIESVNGVRITGEESGKCFACDIFIAPNGKHTINAIKQAPAMVQNNEPKHNEFEREQLLKDLYSESMANVMANPFAQFMANLLGENLAYRSLFYYGIGSDVNSNTVYWFRNYDNQLTHSKIISYGSDCKRLKGEHSKIKWFNKYTGVIKHSDGIDGYAISSGEYPQFEWFSKKHGFTSKKMFGEHLLNPNYKHLNLINGGAYKLDGTAPIVLVESEKTAYLCGLLYPKIIFIACGGANGVTQYKVENLLNRTVFIAFDNDSTGLESVAKVQQLIPNAIALNPAILGITDKKADLFDFLLSDGKRLEQALHIYNAPTSFNYNINLACDVNAPAMIRRKAVA